MSVSLLPMKKTVLGFIQRGFPYLPQLQEHMVINGPFKMEQREKNTKYCFILCFAKQFKLSDSQTNTSDFNAKTISMRLIPLTKQFDYWNISSVSRGEL